METVWDKARPILLALSVHMLALALLYIGMLRSSEWPASNTVVEPIIEATLVGAPSQMEPRLASEPQPLARQTPQLKYTGFGEDGSRATIGQDTRPQEVQTLAAQRYQAQVESPPQQEQNNDNLERLAPEVPAPQDLLAQMREQRAEAERQRQAIGQIIKQSEDAKARHMQANRSLPSIASAHSMIDSRSTDQQILIPFFAASQFNADRDWTFDGALQWQHCHDMAHQELSQDTSSADWIDCLLDASVQDAATQTTFTFGLRPDQSGRLSWKQQE